MTPETAWDYQMSVDLDNTTFAYSYQGDFYAGNVSIHGFDGETDGNYSYNFRRSSSVKTLGALIAFA